MSFYSCLIVMLGGALGTLARYFVSVLTAPISRYIPWGTIIGVNMVGSFVIGFFGTLTLASGRYPVSETTRLFVMHMRWIHHVFLLQPANAGPYSRWRLGPCAGECGAVCYAFCWGGGCGAHAGIAHELPRHSGGADQHGRRSVALFAASRIRHKKSCGPQKGTQLFLFKPRRKKRVPPRLNATC